MNILNNFKAMFYYYAYLHLPPYHHKQEQGKQHIVFHGLINTNHFYKLDNLTSLELYLAYDSNDSWRF